MNTKTKKYKSLYNQLDNIDYILNNEIEGALFPDGDNCELYEALLEYTRECDYRSELKYLSFNCDELDKLKELYPNESLDSLLEKNIIDTDEVDDLIRDYTTEGCSIYQSYIIDENSVELLQDYGQFVYYIKKANLWIWGVTHFGTSWSIIMGQQYPVKNKEYYLI